jgi:hypothetical protein
MQFLLSFLAIGAIHANTVDCPSLTIDKTVTDTANLAYSPKRNYVQQVVDFGKVRPFFDQLNATFGPLRSRGEAHITVVTPPEFQVLQSQVSIQELDGLAQDPSLQATEFSIVCLARQSPTNSLFTYNLIVDAPGLFEYRRKVQSVFEQRGGQGFDAEFYFPHITLGFEQRDYHISDGIFKNATTCICPLQLV